MENVTIRDCYSEDYGGGLQLANHPRTVTLKNVGFFNNTAHDHGGALNIDDLNNSYEFKFEATNCFFSGNTANKGGAVKIYDDDENKGNPTVFRDCIFTYNESSSAGSALYVADNRVVLQGGTIQKNKAGTMGAVYVLDDFDINVGGTLMVKDNTAKEAKNQNFVLKTDGSDRAHIFNAGLDEGAYIAVSNSGSKYDFAAVKDTGQYQTKYFYPENGTLEFLKLGERDSSIVTASLVGEGSVKMMIIAAAVIVLTGVIYLIRRKKRGGSTNDDDDEE